MTTGPLGKLYIGDRIDDAWEVQDIFWRKDDQIFVLKRLFDGVQKYFSRTQLFRFFGGDGNNK